MIFYETKFYQYRIMQITQEHYNSIHLGEYCAKHYKQATETEQLVKSGWYKNVEYFVVESTNIKIIE